MEIIDQCAPARFDQHDAFIEAQLIEETEKSYDEYENQAKLGEFLGAFVKHHHGIQENIAQCEILAHFELVDIFFSYLSNNDWNNPCS